MQRLINRAKRANLKLAPFIGMECPRKIEPDGSIDSGGQNLPANWLRPVLTAYAAAVMLVISWPWTLLWLGLGLCWWRELDLWGWQAGPVYPRRPVQANPQRHHSPPRSGGSRILSSPRGGRIALVRDRGDVPPSLRRLGDQRRLLPDHR